MPATHHYFSWAESPLASVTGWIAGTYQQGSILDLSPLILVLNSQHAQLRLQELLVDHCQQNDLIYTPPQFVGVGELAEHLYTPQHRFATSIEQQLLWIRALQSLSADVTAAVLPDAPKADEFSRWLTIAQTICDLHKDLASEMKRFFSGRDVIAASGDVSEIARWDFLTAAQKRYWELLREYKLWDKQTARMIAVDQQECRAKKQIVLIGAVDLNQVLRAMLQQVQDHVVVLSFADTANLPALEQWFDALGCLKIDAWVDREILVPEKNISVVDKPGDQAEQVIGQLLELDQVFRADQITIGVPDPDVLDAVKHALDQHDLPFYSARGQVVGETPLFRLTSAIADYCATGHYQDFAALIRHPMVVEFVSRQVHRVDWLKDVDAWYLAYLQTHISDAELVAGDHAQPMVKSVKQVIGIVLRCLQPLVERDIAPLNHWPQAWQAVMNALLGRRVVSSLDPADGILIQSLRKFSQGLEPFELVPDDWSFPITCLDFFRLLQTQIESQTVAFPSEEPGIELLGWLDIPLDDAPVSIVTSFNEGQIPSSDAVHPFLKQSLRTELGLLDNRRRYARDAYALELLRHSRQHYHLILGKQNSDGERMMPSRLLMSLGIEALPQRTKFLFSPEKEATIDQEDHRVSSGELPIAQPLPLSQPIGELRVTDFKAYLACPYRFYLGKVLRLKSVDDQVEELDGGSFGSLLHDTLESFGRSDLKDSDQSPAIQDFLQAELWRQAESKYGKRLPAAIRLQLTQAKLRLASFAVEQAKHRREGWVIGALEQQVRYDLEVDGQAFTIVGRIDRLDIHQHDHRCFVLDYKTGDTFMGLDKLYFTGKKDDKRWVDLQLPLYRHMVRNLHADLLAEREQGSAKLGAVQLGAVQLGLIAIPKALDQVQFVSADWDHEQLRAADLQVEEVIRRVRNQVFWPPAEETGYDRGIELICQSGVLRLSGA